MCYSVATPQIWKEIFNVNSLDDIVNYIKDINNKNIIKEGHGNIGWSLDQKELFKKVFQWKEKTNNFITLNQNQTGFRRLDRKYFQNF